MKHEINITQPEFLFEDWPGKYEIFSWLEYVVTVPNPIFIITTRKANGAPNACLHAWGMLVGDRDNYTSLLAMHDYFHTYANILREGEWCVNFPGLDIYPQSFQTINVNQPDNDEITDAGLTGDTEGEAIEIIAHYADGGIAALINTYGEGKVAAIGPHPEADESWSEEEEGGEEWVSTAQLLAELLEDMLSVRAVTEE